MGQNDNGIRQSPFSDAWPTPGVAGEGANGIGGMDAGAFGPEENGLHDASTPWSAHFTPVPGGASTPVSDLGIPAPTFIRDVEGQAPDSTPGPDYINTSRNTIDVGGGRGQILPK